MNGADAQAFIAEFRGRHGRPPRVLHIGNIANNAFLNATILNRQGFDCDVVSYDQYHIMSCPEWEGDFDGVVTDHFRPDWTRLGGVLERPRWFAQGPRELCIDYLLARRTGRTWRANRLWRELGWANLTRDPRREPFAWHWSRLLGWLSRSAGATRDLLTRVRQQPHPYRLLWAKLRTAAAGSRALRSLVAAPLWLAGALLVTAVRAVWPRREPTGPPAPGDPRWSTDWPRRFAAAFPDRPDQLSDRDCFSHLLVIDAWKRLFEHYDIVQAYATEVTLPMLAEKRPYVAFEHGTLREFVLPDDPFCRLAALGYHRADRVFITNGDCLAYAQRINVTAYSPMLHPFDDEVFQKVKGNRAALRQKYGVRHVFLCPLRHDFSIKGTDRYIRALPALVDAIGRDFRVIMTRYGKQVAESERLARELGVGELIVWTEPFNRVQLIRHMKSVDAVFDQLAVPCFGGTAPQALAVGVPVIMSFDPATTSWIVPEAPPILAAADVPDIVAAVRKAIDPEWQQGYAAAAQQWYHQHHSASRVLAGHVDGYRRACHGTGLLEAPAAS